jgi:hypothetical protein
LTCPNNAELFAERLTEIDGTFSVSAPELNVPLLEFPAYAPKIHNGSGRLRALSVPVAVIPARGLLHKSGNEVSCRFNTLRQVRHHFRISDKTACIISCISTDDDVEAVWDGLKYGCLAEEFARLRAAAVIVPNFSFFIDDVPRVHTLYNRKRICLAARILSDSGCHVIIPLSASTPNDWDFWYALLRENPRMAYVAKEFQTGLCKPTAAKAAIEQLSELQHRLARPLHPVALGGSQFIDSLRLHFERYTIVESRPFLLAAKRQLVVHDLSGRYSEISSPTAPGEPFDALLEQNILARSRRLAS